MEQSATQPTIAKAIDEIKDASEDISAAFIFQKDQVLAKDDDITDEETRRAVGAFEYINQKAEFIGGLKSLTIRGTEGRADFNQIDEYFLAVVASKDVDNGTIDNLNHVLAPAIFKRIQDAAESIDDHSEAKTQVFVNKPVQIEPPPRPELEERFSPQVETLISEPIEFSEPEPEIPAPEYSAFIVDEMRGIGILSGSADSVRLDLITVGRWTELYGEDKVQKIVVKDAKTGKSVECGYEVSHDTRPERRGIASIPEPILRKLQVRKGAKVYVKPIIRREIPEESSEEPIEGPPEPPVKRPRFLPDSPACQLIVEDLSGFSGLTVTDMVRFDEALAERWKEFCGDRKIEEVTVTDSVSGKAVRCRFKILKDSKFNGKGLIQIPKSIRKELAVNEGCLVIVKPVLW